MKQLQSRVKNYRLSHSKKPSIKLVDEELFELWRSLDIRIYLQEYIEEYRSAEFKKLKDLRDNLARSLGLSKKIRHDFFDTYYSNVIQIYNHEVFHEVIGELGYEDSELQSLTAQELIDQICDRHNLGI